MTILYIDNTNADYHYFFIETVIVKYKKIFKINVDYEDMNIYISIYQKNGEYSDEGKSFKKYILDKYPNIIFDTPSHYDYYFKLTLYKQHLELVEHNSKTKIYLLHNLSGIDEKILNLSNVVMCTSLSKNFINFDVLPFSNEKVKTKEPIYIIQGGFIPFRRHFPLLLKILSVNYDYNFKFKLVGNGPLPEELNKYKDKLIIKKNLRFIEYHKEFCDAYCILPLITKKTNATYYNYRATSSVLYASGYKLKCLIDKDLQDIVNLDNVEIFNDENDIINSFTKTLEDFYKNKHVLDNK